MAITKIPAAGFTGNNFRNIIINGDMSIAQRGTSTSSITTSGYYTVDRYATQLSSLGTWTQSQSTDVPSGQGFGYSLKWDCTTANASPSSTEFFLIGTNIEGQNLQYLKKGTANAESLTLSFWVKSNKTGTYIAELQDTDNTRTIGKSYTIDSASTWEKKTITFAGDTTGAFDNDNNLSLALNFYLGAGPTFTSGTLQTSWGSTPTADRLVGQVNLADNTANEWYITGVQLEAGTTASDFEFLPYDVNLQRCLRYYQVIADNDVTSGSVIANASSYSSSVAYGVLFYRTTMRAEPSADQSSVSDGFTFLNNAGSNVLTTFTIEKTTPHNLRLKNTQNMAITQGDAGWYQTSTGGYFALDAEL